MSKLPELLFPSSLGFGKHQSLDQAFWRLPYPAIKVARKQSNEREEENSKVNIATKRLFFSVKFSPRDTSRNCFLLNFYQRFRTLKYLWRINLVELTR